MPKATQLPSGEAGFEPWQPGHRDGAATHDTLPNKRVPKAGQVRLGSSWLENTGARRNELEREDSVASLGSQTPESRAECEAGLAASAKGSTCHMVSPGSACRWQCPLQGKEASAQARSAPPEGQGFTPRVWWPVSGTGTTCRRFEVALSRCKLAVLSSCPGRGVGDTAVPSVFGIAVPTEQTLPLPVTRHVKSDK